ncbi:MAG: hypothetical protein A49_32060 [Methyloceanibacter sp.]|nr:MAG: hypothetical protein A49_32060 [Methyloceanibacter sp.]
MGDLRDLLVERGEFGLVHAAALGRVELLLQLHAADILLALSEAAPHECQATERQRSQPGSGPGSRPMLYAGRQNAPKSAMDPHDDNSNPWGSLNVALCVHKICGQCGMNKMVCLTISRFTPISGAKMMSLQSNLIISGCIIPR